METTAENQTDYDELTLNPVLAGIEAEVVSEVDQKNKARRYWTPKEEERFYEIWGRENWRLTRHGKNTIFFAQWADELKERHSIDVKPEEIQAKVNQTRAKFRQVKKQLETDKTGARWKKFDIIDKILKNQYRPEDAEPIPPEALENNRDISPTRLTGNATTNSAAAPNATGGQSTPSSITSNSTQDGISNNTPEGNGTVAADHQITVEQTNMMDVTLPEHTLTAGLLFTDQMEIKEEFDDDKTEEFQSDYTNYSQQNHFPTAVAVVPPASGDEVAGEDEEPPQLHQLQTPLQLQQQQQQQQYLQQTATPPTAAATQQQQQPTNYDHSTNASYALVAANHVNASDTNRSLLVNNRYGNGTNTTTNFAATNNQYVNNGNNNNGNYINNTTNMQPPARIINSQPRKRRTSNANCVTHINAAAGGGTVALAADSIEMLYLEEVRKKNHILDEQKDISRKRLLLEERKVTLMGEFFPKCLDLQQKILDKLNTT